MLQCCFLAVALAQAVAAPLPSPTSPATEWAAAIADARKLHPSAAKYTRYQSLYAVPTLDRADWLKILTFHLWSISHESEPGRPRLITPTLFAIDLRDFGIDPHVYGRLSYREPYFRGLPKDLGELVTSQVPFIRADWFFVETSIQDGRGEPGKGTGYYDFIQVTDRASFQKAVGADPKLAEERKRRWRAIVKESNVAFFPRQIERIDALGGGYWFSLDVLDDGKGERNAIRKLADDFRHQAEEHYAIGPAGLPWVMVCDADGKLANSAPDKIGPDTTRKGRRQIIDVAASCVRCHKEILRPIDSWVHESLKAPVTAEVYDDKAVAIRRLYFRDLQGKLKQDRTAFAERLKECNGLSAEANATLYARLWDQYAEARLTLADCARELGVTPQHFRAALLTARAYKKLDPALADLLSAGTIRREHWEEVYPLAQSPFSHGWNTDETRMKPK